MTTFVLVCQVLTILLQSIAIWFMLGARRRYGRVEQTLDRMIDRDIAEQSEAMSKRYEERLLDYPLPIRGNVRIDL